MSQPTPTKSKGLNVLGVFLIGFAGLFVTVAGIILTSIVAAVVYVASPNRTTEVTIDHKERATRGEESVNMIYTNRGTYAVFDSGTRLAVRSADTYGMLREGCTYKVTHYGFRSGWFSSFPNVVDAEHVATPACPTNGGMPARSRRR